MLCISSFELYSRWVPLIGNIWPFKAPDNRMRIAKKLLSKNLTFHKISSS